MENEINCVMHDSAAHYRLNKATEAYLKETKVNNLIKRVSDVFDAYDFLCKVEPYFSATYPNISTNINYCRECVSKGFVGGKTFNLVILEMYLFTENRLSKLKHVCTPERYEKTINYKWPEEETS